jgi:hypothetical protein
MKEIRWVEGVRNMALKRIFGPNRDEVTGGRKIVL